MRRIAIVLGFSVMLIRLVGGSPAKAVPDEGVPVRTGAAKPARVDLNTAGIGETFSAAWNDAQTAERIIGNRPYRNLDELITKKVVGRKEFAQIREYVVIGSGKK